MTPQDLSQGNLVDNVAFLRREIDRRMRYVIGCEPGRATLNDWRLALAFSLRDRIVDSWLASRRRVREEGLKRVYYLSMEFLIGRLISDAITNLGLEDASRQALASFGQDYDAVVAEEPDAALGNGGLGRLAACFLESMATIGLPAIGYGVRYDHGLFRQSFRDGWQIESPEDWLKRRNPWEFERPEDNQVIGFGGEMREDASGRAVWTPGETVMAAAYDTPIVGWKARWTDTLRLWAAKPTRIFDLERFNRGDFLGAAEQASLAQTLSRVLYPDDTTEHGRELRLKQEYFFTAASVRDILARFRDEHGDDLRKLPQKVAIQLNDTHPTIAAPELVRILVDENGFEVDEAIETARGVLNYTNHTLLPEALERWSTSLMWRVLPRHMRLIERIDDWHIRQNRAAGRDRPPSTWLIDQGETRMGNLAFVMANKVNGVSALHTDLMKKTVFHDFHQLHPDRIVNQTNGVTPRRWLYACNPPLRKLLLETIGEGWTEDLGRLEDLEPHLKDSGFLEKFAAAKRENKVRLSNWLKARTGVEADPDALFDVQIKRIHEYKRQHLNLLETIAHWNAIRREPDRDWVPRVRIFGGKAAPGYALAKQIIKLINDVAKVINADPLMKGRLVIAYPENYNVSAAEVIIPAADLSEQISTAGKEASGTGNMKFAMNGAPTIGTLDGANVEIRDLVGAENFFLFGLTAEGAVEARRRPDHAAAALAASPALREAVDQIASGVFSPDDHHRFASIAENLRRYDYFLVCSDFDDYAAAQRRVDEAYRKPQEWARLAATNTARVGWFSSDRTIRSYAREVWTADTAF
ncbi:glycogen/starch/alpha-glucan phosphorylase [Neomegalonema sp.]|uniref:glycogen/starch/alpha-glucan phosphorylase n=1 Tax=Neomegalonema sp. TaxID=2039713 RepID=UPI0026048CEB|nr:glycogen/starch/alpha-glucan phosphorylase [Neomegalonema sp.]MDD2868716.1 glycogen/starch/alpha-glucan phosphorylase [Neomegalonema sp.]